MFKKKLSPKPLDDNRKGKWTTTVNKGRLYTNILEIYGRLIKNIPIYIPNKVEIKDLNKIILPKEGFEKNINEYWDHEIREFGECYRPEFEGGINTPITCFIRVSDNKTISVGEYSTIKNENDKRRKNFAVKINDFYQEMEKIALTHNLSLETIIQEINNKAFTKQSKDR